MAETGEQDYLSIGEVLGLLLEEFPDVTISKIRFLESQGLIDPERTPSGYRKFYEADVELLRVILREQRENYLPLRVIRDRIETGVIDPSGEMAKPQQSSDDTASFEVPTADPPDADPPEAVRTTSPVGDDPWRGAEPPAGRPVVTTSTDESRPDVSIEPAAEPATEAATDGATDVVDTGVRSATPRLLPGVLLDRSDLCALVGLTGAQLDELERYGVVQGRGSGAGAVYGDEAVEIATIAVSLLRAGIDARHLRGFRTSAEREVSLYEQLVTPRLRQRNPAARSDALDQLRALDELGGQLRSALVRSALRHHFDA